MNNCLLHQLLYYGFITDARKIESESFTILYLLTKLLDGQKVLVEVSVELLQLKHQGSISSLEIYCQLLPITSLLLCLAVHVSQGIYLLTFSPQDFGKLNLWKSSKTS